MYYLNTTTNGKKFILSHKCSHSKADCIGRDEHKDLCEAYGAAVACRFDLDYSRTPKMRSHMKRTSWKSHTRSHQWIGETERAFSRKEERLQYNRKMEREHILSIPPWDVRFSHNLLQK